MAIDAFAGSSGRVKLTAAITVNTSGDDVTFAGTPATVAEFEDWRIQYSMNTNAKVRTFESDANSQRVVHEQQLHGGTASWSARCQAAETAVTGVLAIGSMYVADFLLSKLSTGTGRKNANVKLIDIQPGTGVNDPYAKVTLVFDGDGVLPAVS